nr:MAG TPA: hypothetical protein [Caudoviricetes sp.]
MLTDFGDRWSRFCYLFFSMSWLLLKVKLTFASRLYLSFPKG